MDCVSGYSFYNQVVCMPEITHQGIVRLTSQRDRTIKTEFRQMGYFRISRGIKEKACGISRN